jgi:hypothetical protein
LLKLLRNLGLGDEEITLFRGVNDHERAQQALGRWKQEEGARFPPGTKPSREVALRLALVHEFRTRSRVLICTEAGAKGLNLQFCETVINYSGIMARILADGQRPTSPQVSHSMVRRNFGERQACMAVFLVFKYSATAKNAWPCHTADVPVQPFNPALSI